MTTTKSILNLLTKLVGTPSIYPNEKKISSILEKELVKRGFDVKTQKVSNGRLNIFASKGKGQAILFYGHMDTVPVVNPEKWKTSPFRATLKKDKVYGLGTSDMKGGISAFVEAASRSNTPVKIFLAVDEENISEGAWKAVSERKEFFKDVDLIISAESSFNLGLNGPTVGRTGRCIYEIVFKGKPKHIIKYKVAIDSLKKLSDFGSALYTKRDRMFASKDTVAQLRKVYGESKGMSVCGEAGAEIEVILGAQDSVHGVLKKLQSLTNDKVKVKTRKTPYLEGYYFNSFPYKEIFERIIKAYTNQKMTLHTRKSVGDDNVLATLKIPVITWGPEGDNEHVANEYVRLSSLVTLSKMYKDLLDSVGRGIN